MSIILDQVQYIYGQDGNFTKKALSDISLVIDRDEMIGLIGHTGSGKSTLIQLMNGLLKPTAGKIYFDGQDIADKKYDLKKLRSKVGIVFQYPEHQLFETTVFKDVCFGPKNLGLSQKEAELRAFWALETVGMEPELFEASPFELSGGQKKRAAIAGTLAMKPEYLILDEPTAGLDPAGRDEILNLLRRMHEKEHTTIILVSNSMEDMARFADRILVMENGRLKYDDSTREVFRHVEEMEKLGLSVPAVTYIMRELAGRGYPVDSDAITVEEAYQSLKRILC